MQTGSLLSLPLDEERLTYKIDLSKNIDLQLRTMVGALGFEPRISWSQTRRVKPFPNTPSTNTPENQKAPKFFRTRGLEYRE